MIHRKVRKMLVGGEIAVVVGLSYYVEDYGKAILFDPDLVAAITNKDEKFLAEVFQNKYPKLDYLLLKHLRVVWIPMNKQFFFEVDTERTQEGPSEILILLDDLVIFTA